MHNSMYYPARGARIILAVLVGALVAGVESLGIPPERVGGALALRIERLPYLCAFPLVLDDGESACFDGVARVVLGMLCMRPHSRQPT